MLVDLLYQSPESIFGWFMKLPPPANLRRNLHALHFFFDHVFFSRSFFALEIFLKKKHGRLQSVSLLLNWNR